MNEIIAAYGILCIKAIRMYVAHMHFDALFAFVLGELHELTVVYAISAKIRLDGNPTSLAFPIDKPLRFRHRNLPMTFDP